MIDVHCVTFDCDQPYELATFWRDASGGELHPDTEKNDEEVLLQGGRVDLLFIKVPEDKAVKNRVHLDITGSAGTTRDEEVERLAELGATISEDHRNPDGSGWVTMLDPEGNEFCVCRADYERV
ncbi:VOC family protein [Streptosporangium sp. OZ121]|uniref:VOC family protein n=1 Tax=Streptosporangium sp. OZ121 TaxID=3444183 RepID=UPI003F7AA04B